MQNRRQFSTLLAGAGLTTGLASGATVPRPAPEFGFEVPGGKQVLLSQHKGKLIMLGFYLTTCPHCKDTVRVIEKLYKEYASQGFQPLGICINDMAKMLTADFIKEQGATFPIGYGPRDAAYGFLQHPTMLQLYMPAIVMIDQKGTIVGQYPGGDPIFGMNLVDREKNLRKLIESNLKPAAKSTTAPKKAAAKKVG